MKKKVKVADAKMRIKCESNPSTNPFKSEIKRKKTCLNYTCISSELNFRAKVNESVLSHSHRQ